MQSSVSDLGVGKRRLPHHSYYGRPATWYLEILRGAWLRRARLSLPLILTDAREVCLEKQSVAFNPLICFLEVLCSQLRRVRQLLHDVLRFAPAPISKVSQLHLECLGAC